MDEQPITAAETAAPTAPAVEPNPALEAYIAKGRELVSTTLEPLDRLAQSSNPWSHEFATAAAAVRAGFHALLSHVLHEDHPGVIAEAAKLAEPVVDDAEGVLGAVAAGSVSGALAEGSAAVEAAAAGAAIVAADVATGTPLVSSEDVASTEAAVAEGIAGSATASEAEPSAAELLS